MDINRCCFTGRLGGDVELKKTPSGMSVCSFNLAVDRAKAKDADKSATDWITLIAWGKTAEFCSKYLAKGMKVSVEASARTNTWEDKDGHKHRVVEFPISTIVPAESRKAKEGDSGTEGFSAKEDETETYPLDADGDVPF